MAIPRADLKPEMLVEGSWSEQIYRPIGIREQPSKLFRFAQCWNQDVKHVLSTFLIAGFWVLSKCIFPVQTYVVFGALAAILV